jgi:hypothetical protein
MMPKKLYNRPIERVRKPAVSKNQLDRYFKQKAKLEKQMKAAISLLGAGSEKAYMLDRDIDRLTDNMRTRMIDDAFDALRSGVTIEPQHDRCHICLRKIEKGSGPIELEVEWPTPNQEGKPPHMAFLHERCADELEELNAP